MTLEEDFNNSNLPAILHQYAAYRMPDESCGYILDTDDGLAFFGCANIHDKPRNNFTIAATSYAKASRYGKIVAVFHSHTGGNLEGFSARDRKACNKGKLPWVMLKLPEGFIRWLYPGDKQPLLGREFIWGEQDCCGLIRAIYDEIGIKLSDPDRGELMVEVDGREEFAWNAIEGWNLYLDNFEKEGFRRLDPREETQKYDVILFNFEAPFGVANHAGVLMEPESNIFYQHLLGRLSEKTIYGEGWRLMTMAVLRHKKLDEGVKINAYGDAYSSRRRERQILQEDRFADRDPRRPHKGDDG